MSQRLKLDDLPETWYNQFFEKYKASKSYRLQFGDSETEKRTPEQMSFYRKVVENHKRRRVAFKVDQNIGFGMLDDGSNLQNSSSDNDNPFFPETMSAMNCVPDSAVLRTSQLKENQKVEFNGVLDTLPQIMTKSPIMIERLGIRPEYLSMDQGSNQNLGKNGAERSKKCLGEMQALKLSQKVMARLLGNVGFEGSSEVPLDVLTKFMSCHIRKLGSTLKLLSDSYRKQCTAMELLKMFLHTDGHRLVCTSSYDIFKCLICSSSVYYNLSVLFFFMKYENWFLSSYNARFNLLKESAFKYEGKNIKAHGCNIFAKEHKNNVSFSFRNNIPAD